MIITSFFENNAEQICHKKIKYYQYSEESKQFDKGEDRNIEIMKGSAHFKGIILIRRLQDLPDATESPKTKHYDTLKFRK